MKKLILKIVSIAAAFLLGIVFMSYYLAAGNNDLTESMTDATLPLIYMEQDGRLLNLMHGYTEPMEGGYMRDSVLPIPADRKLTLQIQPCEAKVEKISCEIRSLDTARLIEDTQLSGYSLEDGFLKAEFQPKDLLDEGEEYLLVIRLTLKDEREVYYYTRLARLSETHLAECLDFVDLIHEATFDKENTVSIAQYLEPDSSADNNTLSHVTIHSRYRQIIWGDMEVQVKGQVRTYLTEIENSIASVRLEYQVTNENDDGVTETYDVQEAYRVRCTNQRMYLLDYDRTMDRIFEPAESSFAKNRIDLGILNTEVEYRKNEEENVVGFVQNGQLWCYDAAQNKLSLVFGFRDGSDLRCSYGEHSIRILSVDETGSMNFLVSGYMNRGQHEGRTGVAVYTYDAMANSVEERVFLESSKPFQILEAELGDLAYINSQEQLYLYFQGNICRIDLNTREYEELVTGISRESCLVSEDGQIVAWHGGASVYDSDRIELMYLETGRRWTMKADEGFYVRALGFMGRHFIYGQARREDVTRDIAGSWIFPMGYVTILDEKEKVLREFPYEEQGKYVVDIAIEGNRISLDCVTKTADGGYEEALPEPITYAMEETAEKITLDTRSDAVKKREYVLTLSEGRGTAKLKYLTPKQVLFEGSRSLRPEEREEDSFYYVYAFDGSFAGAYESASQAVLTAYDRMGAVVDGSQNYIWMRGGRKTRTELSGLSNPQQRPGESSLQAALEILLGSQKVYSDTAAYLAEGYTPCEILESQLNGRALDLSGCSVSMVLYYVSQGYPVLALEGNNRAELITGYDPQNIILMDPLTEETYRKGMNDSAQMFEELGNLFVVCLPENDG